MNLNRFVLCMTCVAALSAFVTGCVTESKYGEFKPKGELAASDIASYNTYEKAMASVEGRQMAYEWQRKNQKLVEDATKPEVISAFVASSEAADAVLAKIGTSYDGDPLVLTQIASVTQFVMCPKCDKAKAGRSTWVAALKRARANTDDGYVKTFCDQQLRICE